MPATECRQIMAPLNVVIAGGGTGGHLFPGIAVADAFIARNPDSRILFVGAGRPFEKEALARAGFPQETIAIEGIKGRGWWARIRALVKIPRALVRSSGILDRARADLVVGVGGYAAGPVALAAWLKGIPMVLCEQNSVPGITNRMLFPLAKRIYVSFENTRGEIDVNKKRVTGNPVRQQIVAAPIIAADKKQRFTVLVVGGSQGAHAINLAVMEALAHLQQPERFSFVHQTGADDREIVAAAYDQAGIQADARAFFHDMAAQYSRADLVVCRAGATTVAELTAMGRAALFIPYPFAADNHQEHNAQALVDQGAARMMRQQDLSGIDLARHLEALADAPEALVAMAARSKALGRPDAAQAIVDDCYQLIEDKACI